MKYFQSITLTTLLGLTVFTSSLTALDRTWVGTTNNLALFSNWNLPSAPTGTELGLFSATGNHKDPLLSNSTPMTFGGIRYTDNTPYTITVNDFSEIILQSVGVENQGTGAQTFNIDDNSFINFKNAASADVGNTGKITYNILANSSMTFSNNANAGAAKFIANQSLGNLTFQDTSTAANSNIELSGISTSILMTDNSTAGNAQISATGAGNSINFINSATAASSTLQLTDAEYGFSNDSVGGTCNLNSDNSFGQFRNSSDAGAATIVATNGSVLEFLDLAQAGTADMGLTDSTLNFLNNTFAANSTISLSNSLLTFNQGASAGTSTTTASGGSNVNFLATSTANQGIFNLDNSNLTFQVLATAELSNITGNNGSQVTFEGSSTAATATINANASNLSFEDFSTAATSSINANSGSQVAFTETSTAATSIINADASNILFENLSTAATSNMSANNGSQLTFADTSSAATSTIHANSSTVSFIDNSLSSSANIALANSSLNFAQTSSDAFTGVVSGSGGINKSGVGNLNFLGDGSSFAGLTQITGGNFALNSNLGGSVVVSGAGILSGIGNALGDVSIDNGGTISPGNSIGTINILGNYVQNPGSIYLAEINAAGQSDLINVAGTATINGGRVMVIGEPGAYVPGTDYTLLQATGGVFGTYSSLTTNLNMRSFLKYFPNSVVLALGDPLANILGLSGNPLRVANYINSFTNIGPDLMNVIEVLENLTPNALYRALDQMHPAPFEAISLTAADTAHLVTESFTDRLNYIRRLGNPCNPCNTCSKGGAWVSGVADFVRVDRTQGLRRFNQDSQGVALGYDNCLFDNTYVGLGGGYTHSHIRWKQSYGFINVNSGYVGAYASTFNDTYYVDGAVIAFVNNNRAKRHIQFSTIDRRAKSNHYSYGFNPHLGAGLFYSLCNISVIPFFELDYYYVKQNKFHEKGAGDLNLYVKRNQSNLLRLETGINFYKNYTFACGEFVPNAKVSYVANRLLSGKRYRSSFGGSPDSFSVYGTNHCFNQIELGIGLTYLINDRFAINFGYDVELGKKRQEQELNLDLYYQF